MKHRVVLTLLMGLVACPVSGAWADDLPPVIDTPGIGSPGTNSVAPPTVNRPSAAKPRVAAPAVPQKQDIESRISRLERVLASGTLVNMAVKLDTMQEQVRHMQGANEELAHDIESIKHRQRDLYMDIDRRLSDIETALKNLKKSTVPAVATDAAGQQAPGSEAATSSSAVAPGVIVATPAPAAPSSGATGTSAAAANTPAVSAGSTVSPLQEQSDYEAALAVLRSGDYESAQEAFSKFLATYPQGAFADNAYYWQGEANYVMRRYEEAIASFSKVMTLFPESAKVPAAMLKTGFSHYGLKQWDKAREILEKVKTQYPQGSVAQLAEKRLHRMKIEGH